MAPRARSSPRCRTCQRRKVKCDYAHPACQRCIASRLDCEGYSQDLVFVVYDADAKPQSPHDEQLTAFSKEFQWQDDTDSFQRPNENTVSRRDNVVRRQRRRTVISRNDGKTIESLNNPSLHFDSCVAPCLLHILSYSTEEARSYGHLDFLPGVLQDLPENRPFLTVSHAFVRVFMAHQSHAPVITTKQLATLYQNCLVSIKSAIMDQTSQVHDSTIAAVWLLGCFELLNGSFPAGAQELVRIIPHTWSIQTEGLESLLKLRGLPSKDEKNKSVFWPCFTAVQCRYVMSGRSMPEWFNEWLQAIESSESEDDLIPIIFSNYIGAIAALNETMVSTMRFGSFEDAANLFQQVISKASEAKANFDATITKHSKLYEKASKEDPYFTTLFALCSCSLLKLHHNTILLCTFIDKFDNGSPAQQIVRIASKSQSELSFQEIDKQSKEMLLRSEMLLEALDQPQGPSNSPSSQCYSSWADALRLALPLSTVARLPTIRPQCQLRAHDLLMRIDRLGVRQAQMALRITRPYELPVIASWTSDCCISAA